MFHLGDWRESTTSVTESAEGHVLQLHSPGAPGGTQCGNRITVVTSGTSRRTLIGESIDARRTRPPHGHGSDESFVMNYSRPFKPSHE
jgi:hypothetical protein